jgi:hypothetical protein
MRAPRAALLALLLVRGAAHPMHTAVTEITQEQGENIADVRLRVYADDWEGALRLPSDVTAADSVMSRYLRGTFALAGRNGRPIRLAWQGAARSGDVVLIGLRGVVAGGLAGARVTSLVLCDRFPDQVNIVRATYAGRATTLLFTRGEASKALP